jgi:nucleotide-binding universal stress UspA family protein
LSGRIDERCVHLQQGTESAEALALVEARGSDLVVLGSVGPDAGLGVMIREEVENLVQRVSCSILAIKPAGFRSPIRLEDG